MLRGEQRRPVRGDGGQPKRAGRVLDDRNGVFEEQCVGAMPPKVGKKAVAKKKERMIEDKVSVCVNCAAQHHPFEPISCPVDGHAMYAVVVE